VQPVDDVLEPVELVAAWLGFEQCPGEDPDGGEGETGRRHGLDVLVQRLRTPLLGVDVAAVQQPVTGPARHRHGSTLSSAEAPANMFAQLRRSQQVLLLFNVENP
jgi:hypothetical protein